MVNRFIQLGKIKIKNKKKGSSVVASIPILSTGTTLFGQLLFRYLKVDFDDKLLK